MNSLEKINEPENSPNCSADSVPSPADLNAGRGGFSLIETIFAMLILLIALLGVFTVFTYGVIYNTANSTRSKSLAVLQQEAELIRAAKFTPAITDPVITGGTKPNKVVVLADGSKFRVKTVVDDDPFTAGVDIDSTETLKEVTITVTPVSSVGSWQAAVPATLIVRRVRSN